MVLDESNVAQGFPVPDALGLLLPTRHPTQVEFASHGSAPPLDATRPLSWSTTPCGEFEEDFVDGLSLENGTVDDFGVNVIVDHNALRGSIFFVGAGDTEQFPPAEEAEDLSGDFQHVSVHTFRTSTLHCNVSLIAGIATDSFMGCGGTGGKDYGGKTIAGGNGGIYPVFR